MIVLDRQEDIEHAIHRIGGQLELLPPRRGVAFGVVPLDPDRQMPRGRAGIAWCRGIMSHRS